MTKHFSGTSSTHPQVDHVNFSDKDNNHTSLDKNCLKMKFNSKRFNKEVFCFFLRHYSHNPSFIKYESRMIGMQAKTGNQPIWVSHIEINDENVS